MAMDERIFCLVTHLTQKNLRAEGWCRGNILELSCGAAQLEHRLKQRLFWGFSRLLSVSPINCWNSPQTSSFQILSNPLFTHHPTIRCYIVYIQTEKKKKKRFMGWEFLEVNIATCRCGFIHFWSKSAALRISDSIHNAQENAAVQWLAFLLHIR
jgi:hypothetical protein